MRYWCATADLGYDQSNRWDVREHGETDCSALVIHALREAGFDTGNASYTGNMREELMKHGWERVAPNLYNAQPGDILLSEAHHTCAVISGYGLQALIAQASIDENGNIKGGKAGDQSGYETNVKKIYQRVGGWDMILRYRRTNAKLDIDGWIGALTVSAWQRALKSPYIDGVISGQDPINIEHLERLIAATWEATGESWLVFRVQRIIGASRDGFIGPETVRKLQEHLNEIGNYKLDPDGYLGPLTAKALQMSLNAGLW